ncbi:MAG: PAS domain S-box protein [Phycisphaeraceae bacterium]|nr:PAS domain S-box protein [Phycisphaeraceae bacterium]
MGNRADNGQGVSITRVVFAGVAIGASQALAVALWRVIGMGDAGLTVFKVAMHLLCLGLAIGLWSVLPGARRSVRQEGAKGIRRTVRRMRWAYLSGLVLLAILFIGDDAVIRSALRASQAESRFMMTAGEYRRTNLQTVLAIVEAQRSAAPTEQVRQVDVVVRNLAELGLLHRQLESQCISTVVHQGAVEMFVDVLQPWMHRFEAHVDAWIAAVREGDEARAAMFADEVRAVSAPLTASLTAMKGVMEQVTGTAVARMERRGVALVSLTLVVLALEILLIFEPSVRRVRRSIEQLEAQRAELRRQAMVVSRTDSAVLICDSSMRIEWVNEGFTNVYGYRLDEAVGRTVAELLSESASGEVGQERMEMSMARGEGLETELVRRKRDGERVWVHVSMQPIRNESGRVASIVSIEHDVTTRKVLEQRLLETSERLDFAARGANVGVWEFTVPGRSVHWEPSMYELLRRDPATFELTHESWRGLVHPDDLERAEAGLYQAAKDGGEYQAQFRMFRPDGSIIHVLSRARIFAQPDGTCRAVGANIDVTDRVQVMEALERSEALLQQVGELARIGGWEFDCRSMTLSWSREVRRIHEVDDDYVPEIATAFHFFPAESRARLQEAVRTAITHGTGSDLELRFISAGGRHSWVRWICTAEMEGGQCVRLRGAMQDITPAKRADKERRHLQQVLQAAIDAMSQMIFWKDVYGRYLGCNRAFLRYTGRESLEEVIGTRDEDYAWGLAAEKYRTDDLMVMRTGEPILAREELSDIGEDSFRWVRTTKVPLREEGEDIVAVLGIVEDVTAEHEAREALRSAKDAAEAADRAKSAFLANMSHEIRTPMTAILGFADLLLDPSRDEAERTEWIKTIRRNGEHLLSIVNDVLDLSKIQADQMSVEEISCSPVQIIEEVVSLLRVSAESKGLTCSLHLDGALPVHVRSDPMRLRQIFLNLVGNAVKFTSEGWVRVDVHLRREGDKSVLEVEVADTGVGMTPDQVERVFDPFMQADESTTRRFGGTGLGLAITRRLVDLLGGDVVCRSTAGEGTVFTVRLPVRAEDAAVCSDHLAQHAPRQDETEVSVGEPTLNGRVLLAEDGPDNQRLLSFHLKRAGATVDIAENGRIAVEKALAASERGEPYAVILMDMQMPEMDGYAATRALRAAGYSGPILALTAHAMTGDRERCLEAGCDDYFTKPIQRDNLILACEKWSRRGRTMKAA